MSAAASEVIVSSDESQVNIPFLFIKLRKIH